MDRAGIAVVGTDGVALATAEALGGEGIPVLSLPGHQLADLHVSLGPTSFRVEGCRIGAVLLRQPVAAFAPVSFVAEDWAFVAAEVAAIWLAATQLEPVLAINRLDAEAWYEGGQWPVWRRRLRRASVALSPLSFGDAPSNSYWRPYLDGHDRPAPNRATRRALGTALADDQVAGATLFVGGDAMGGSPPPAVATAARLLQRSGVQLSSISHDARERVVAVDPFPR